MGSSPVCERGRGCYSVLEICTGLTWACARPTVRMVYSRPARRRYPVPCTHAPAPPLRAQAWPSCAARGAGRGSSGHPRRSGVVPARRWSAKSNAHRLPKLARARRSDAESLPTKRSCALHAASEAPPSTCRRGDMSGESSYLDDVIIRGRSRASDVPDVHPEPEQRLERLVPSVSPVGSRHGLSADFVARSLRTPRELAAGARCAVLLTSLPFQRAIARPLGPRRWKMAGVSRNPGHVSPFSGRRRRSVHTEFSPGSLPFCGISPNRHITWCVHS